MAKGEAWILTSVLAKSHGGLRLLCLMQRRQDLRKEKCDGGCHDPSLFPHFFQRKPGVENIDLTSKYWFNEGSWIQLE